jgi:hypothetical protein
MRDSVEVTAEAGADLIADPLYASVGYLPGRAAQEQYPNCASNR